MNFPSIDIQGSIISSDLLGKIRSEQSTFQQGKDFNKDFTNAKLKDEISFAWQDAKGQWTIFQNKLSRLKEGETATTETRNFWIVPLLTNLGYNLSFNRQAEELNGKTFPIGYRDIQLDGFPVYIEGFYESLDKRPENKQLRVSPHALVQEYLNYSEHLYGMVTNGKLLRLLRDASRITRLSYVEFNLQKMMEEDLYADFVILYRLLHSSRMPQKMDGGAESIIEKYHHEGLEAGSTIRSKLGRSVKEAIKSLANGFINHPDNEILRNALQLEQLDADEYYRQQLRIIYRLLFLFVIEERNLVYADSKTPGTKRFSQIYYNYYSLLRLRKLAKKLPPPEANRHYDLWQNLLSTFALFEERNIGEKLGIMSLQGELFGPDSIATSHYDLHDCRLSNSLLLQIIKSLSYFENDHNLQIAVNYGGLDVEEFGSVYEGLLEMQLNIKPIKGTNQFSCSFASSEERSKSGSHYTPDELVQPLIKHSLDYLLEDRKKIITAIITNQKLTGPAFRTQREELVKQHIYSLKVCDISCGSGHILISGARRIAEVAAGIIEEEEQPNPKAFQLAKRNAILNCIYGVDKNPLAVELCKVALWLEAYMSGQPLNFLDHHIKCGDAIIGLAHQEELDNGIANEAFKTLPGDDSAIAKSFRDRNVSERKHKGQQQLDLDGTLNVELNAVIEKFKLFKDLPEHNPAEVAAKAKAYTQYEQDIHRIRLRQLADAQVAQFFISKTDANKPTIITDAEYQVFLRQVKKGIGILQSNKLAKAQIVATEKLFFHWFLEFPDVFNEGGFDCILGNPPYLGGSKISTNYGNEYSNSILSRFPFSKGMADLVSFFIRRDFELINENRFLALITTDSVSQGATRESGLDFIVAKEANIVFAVKSMKWPGDAAVDVALFSMIRGKWERDAYIGAMRVDNISVYFGNETNFKNPFALKYNLDKVYTGSKIYGDGFILNETQKEELIAKNIKNKEVLFPYLSGDDIANIPDLRTDRFVINFFDWPLARKGEIEKEVGNYKYANDYPDCLEIIIKLVKPEREKLKGDKQAVEKWWQYQRIRSEMYEAIKKNKVVIVIAQTAKYPKPIFVESGQVYSVKVIVFTIESNLFFAILSSCMHEEWIWKYSTTMGTSRVQYSTSASFETFPFPQNISSEKGQQLEQIGGQYHEHRKLLMLSMQLGLTKTCNLFHSQPLALLTTAEEALEDKLFTKQFGKDALHLRKHLAKTSGACSFNEAVQGIIKLRELHVKMDTAVLDAYSWEEVQLQHNFYEVDYLPENDRVRYTIHPDARKEVLKRLLELNHQIHEEEVKKGLWDKKGGKKKGYINFDDELNRAAEPDSNLGGLFKQD
ncbi:MAG TPA: restriction endonuclease [Sphingobacteriaceae bacterium]|nr:restriction endonuclease [Sphingobacteriaceae bacterium]